MKAQILKIAGAKSEKEFYSKFPDEASFLKVHGKAFKKAQMGISMQGLNKPKYTQFPGVPNDFGDISNIPPYGQQMGTYISQQRNPFGSPPQNYNLTAPLSPPFQHAGTIDRGQLAGKIAKKGIGSMDFGEANQYVGAAGDVVQGISMLKGQKYAVQEANQNSLLTGIEAKAASSRDINPTRRNYVRPEDIPIYPNQLFPSYGTGSDILSMQNGGELEELQQGGNIYNTLNNGQFGESMNDYGNDILNNINPYIGHVRGSMPTAGNKIGKGIGTAAGTFFGGPIGGAIGGFAGNLIGGAIDNSDNKIKRYNDISNNNIDDILGSYIGNNIHNRNSAFMENGGNMAMNGELQTYGDNWVETISNNPFLPDGGETVMFHGASHDDDGILTTYGNSLVEVEGGEPATKIDDNLVVFGNMKIPNQFLSEIGDKNAKGKKFKNYINDLSKIEKRQNNIVDRAIDQTNELTPITSFDKLKLTSLNANIIGANMKLKDIAEKKQNTAHVQEAINKTAEEYGLSAEHLSQGKYKKAKNGISMKAQQGGQYDFNPADPFNPYDTRHYVWPGVPIYPSQPQENLFPSKSVVSKPISKSSSSSSSSKKKSSSSSPRRDPLELSVVSGFHPQEPTFSHQGVIDSSILNNSTSRRVYDEETQDNAQGSKFDWENIFNQALPYLRNSNKMNLDPNQLTGELYALSNNQLEPVDAQGYHPQLSSPYDISFQDQLNANQSDFNSIERQIGNNPNALSSLAGQKYEANSKVLGEQFRANQGEKQRVYEGNRNLLNDSQLKNLSIYDQQYTRQSQAKSNTKAITQQALNSISSKIAQNKLENRTLGIYENMYNYRFDNQGRAINENPLAKFDTTIQNASLEELDKIQKAIETRTSTMKKDKNGQPLGTTQTNTIKTEKAKNRNGGIVRAIKNL